MSADLVFRYGPAAGTAQGDLDLQFYNVTGTPIVSVAFGGAGQEIADSYELTFHVAGTVTVDVVCGSPLKNPNQATGVVVTANGTTVNWNVILGVGLVISAAVADANEALVTVGAYMTAGGAVTNVLNVGTLESGSSSPSVQIAAAVTGSSDASEVSVRSLPGFYFTPYNARSFIALVDNHSSTTRETLAVTGTYTITFANWGDGGGGKKQADVMVGGELAISDAIFDGVTRYEYGSGNGYVDSTDRLRGLALVLVDTVADPSAMTVTLVVDGTYYAYAELAEDLTGAPGNFASAALTLTEGGQGDGIITSGSSAPFWFRWNLPVTAVLGVLRLWTLRARGLEV